MPALIVAGEGLVIVGLGLLLVWSAIAGDAESATDALSMGIIGTVTGAGLVVCGIGLWTRHRWARAPAIVWQLLMLPIGLYQLGELWYVGVPVILLALTTIGLLGTARTSAALDG